MPKIFLKDVPKIYLRGVLDIPDKNTRYAWSISMIFHRCGQDMKDISLGNTLKCLRYDWGVQDITLIYALDMSEKHLRYAWYMPEIYSRYMWDILEINLIRMPEICLRYVWDMSEKCLRYF